MSSLSCHRATCARTTRILRFAAPCRWIRRESRLCPGRPGVRARSRSTARRSSRASTVNQPEWSSSTKCSCLGDWEFSGDITYNYATHHRHSCIGARAGFGDLLIGAGALMCEANGLDPNKKVNLRDPMVELIKITEGFYACGVAASVYALKDTYSKSFMPEPVYSNIGKLLLSTQIYDMHRLAHEVSGGLIVALPGPDEDHNPATAATLSEVLRANPNVPYDKRIEVSRFIEDLTASYQGGWYSLISLHGGGSPTALKQEIWRNYPVGSKVELVERLMERGVLAEDNRAITKNKQPGRCCDAGCSQPGQPFMVPLPKVNGSA